MKIEEYTLQQLLDMLGYSLVPKGHTGGRPRKYPVQMKPQDYVRLKRARDRAKTRGEAFDEVKWIEENVI